MFWYLRHLSLSVVLTPDLPWGWLACQLGPQATLLGFTGALGGECKAVFQRLACQSDPNSILQFAEDAVETLSLIHI